MALPLECYDTAMGKLCKAHRDTPMAIPPRSYNGTTVTVVGWVSIPWQCMGVDEDSTTEVQPPRRANEHPFIACAMAVSWHCDDTAMVCAMILHGTAVAGGSTMA